MRQVNARAALLQWDGLIDLQCMVFMMCCNDTHQVVHYKEMVRVREMREGIELSK